MDLNADHIFKAYKHSADDHDAIFVVYMEGAQEGFEFLSDLQRLCHVFQRSPATHSKELFTYETKLRRTRRPTLQLRAQLSKEKLKFRVKRKHIRHSRSSCRNGHHAGGNC